MTDNPHPDRAGRRYQPFRRADISKKDPTPRNLTEVWHLPWHQMLRELQEARRFWNGRTDVAATSGRRCADTDNGNCSIAWYARSPDALVISFHGRPVIAAKIPEPNRTFEVRARQPRLMNRIVTTASFGRYGRVGTD